jgi:hypothetical protein
MTKKEDEKILKYQDLTTQIQCMWSTKTKVIPVIVLERYKNRSKIPEQHIQKA